jgi:hypothetical protein
MFDQPRYLAQSTWGMSRTKYLSRRLLPWAVVPAAVWALPQAVRLFTPREVPLHTAAAATAGLVSALLGIDSALRLMQKLVPPRDIINDTKNQIQQISEGVSLFLNSLSDPQQARLQEQRARERTMAQRLVTQAHHVKRRESDQRIRRKERERETEKDNKVSLLISSVLFLALHSSSLSRSHSQRHCRRCSFQLASSPMARIHTSVQ